jgi:mono/diheme cytochrome c family protein
MKAVELFLLLAVTPAWLIWAGDVQAGRALFQNQCSACHGSLGKGNPALSQVLGVTIADLTSRRVQSQSDAALRKTLAEGKGKMQPMKTQSDSDIDDVISYVRTLAGSDRRR